MYYYYSRISTASQTSAEGLANFEGQPAYNPKNVYLDTVQGNVPFLERTEAGRLINDITDNNDGNVTVVVDSIDKLGRNLLNILSTLEMFDRNSINLKSLRESFETRAKGKENPIAKLVISVMGSIAAMERNRIKERRAEGIKIAKAQGKYRGRKAGSVQSDERLLERHSIVVKKLKKGNMTIMDISRAVSCSTTTVMKVKKVLAKKNIRANDFQNEITSLIELY